MSKRVELDVPEGFLKEYDEAISKHFATRAEAMRAAMREQMKTLGGS